MSRPRLSSSEIQRVHDITLAMSTAMNLHRSQTLVAVLVLTLVSAAYVHAQQQLDDSLIHIPAPYVVFVQFTRDGSHFLTRQADTVRVWNVDTRKQVGPPIATGSGNCCVALLPGDTTVLTLAYNKDSAFKVWDWRNGALVRTVKLFRTVIEAAVTGDGKHILILVTSPVEQYEMWNLSTELYEDAFFPAANMTGILADSVAMYTFAESVHGLAVSLLRIDIARHRSDSVPINVRDVARLYLSHDGQRIMTSRQKHPPLILDAVSLDSLFSLDMDINNFPLITMDYGFGHRQIVTLTSRRSSIPVLELWNGETGAKDRVVIADPSMDHGEVRLSPRGDYVVVFNLQTETVLVHLDQGTTGVSAVAGLEPMSLDAYPNPCHTDFAVKFHQPIAGRARITLFSQTGSAMISTALGGREIGDYVEHLQTAELSCGLYFCMVEMGALHSIIPIIVER